MREADVDMARSVKSLGCLYYRRRKSVRPMPFSAAGDACEASPAGPSSR
jgi:hypothetical protein